VDGLERRVRPRRRGERRAYRPVDGGPASRPAHRGQLNAAVHVARLEVTCDVINRDVTAADGAELQCGVLWHTDVEVHSHLIAVIAPVITVVPAAVAAAASFLIPADPDQIGTFRRVDPRAGPRFVERSGGGGANGACRCHVDGWAV